MNNKLSVLQDLQRQALHYFFSLTLISRSLRVKAILICCNFLFLLCILSENAVGQHPNVLISTLNYPNEPAISINPKNPNSLVAGANNDNYYLSNDGGSSWTEGTLTSTYGVWGDPCIICDTAGNFYFFHLSNPAVGNWIDRIVCQKITPPSSVWSQGSFTFYQNGKQQDKEWAVVNPYNNDIYVTWTQFDNYGSTNPQDSSVILFAKSTDGGTNWSAVKRISDHAGDCIDSDNTVEGAVPSVGPNGEIYVVWGVDDKLIFDKSTDGGISWLAADQVISTQPGGWDFGVPGISRCNGMPVTCCDLSNGPYRGNIYVNFSDQRNGITDTDVWLIKSTDGGNTWSSVKRVNDDVAGKQQFFTWMTVDQYTGYLYFVFYDRRNYSDNNTDVYMAVSKDGGETFTNFKVSESPFLPEENIFFGDYNNISAYNNIIRPIWTRLANGNLSIYTALVDPTLVNINESDDYPVSIEQVFPNPFEQSTHFSYKIRRSCTISLKVLNIMGKEIVTLINKVPKSAGKYIETFDAGKYQLTPGVYFFQLSSDTTLQKRQMIVVK